MRHYLRFAFATFLSVFAAGFAASAAQAQPAIKVTHLSGSHWGFGSTDVFVGTRCRGGATGFLLRIDAKPTREFDCGRKLKITNGAFGIGEHRARFTPIRTDDSGRILQRGRPFAKRFTIR